MSLLLNVSPKRIQFVLKDGSCVEVANTSVQVAIYSYGGGSVPNAAWMILEQKAVVTTSAAGVVSIAFTGTTAKGGMVYVAVLIPALTLSLIWTTRVL